MKKQYVQPELEIRRLLVTDHIAGPSDNDFDVGGGDIGNEDDGTFDVGEVGGQIG